MRLCFGFLVVGEVCLLCFHFCVFFFHSFLLFICLSPESQSVIQSLSPSLSHSFIHSVCLFFPTLSIFLSLIQSLTLYMLVYQFSYLPAYLSIYNIFTLYLSGYLWLCSISSYIFLLLFLLLYFLLFPFPPSVLDRPKIQSAVAPDGQPRLLTLTNMEHLSWSMCVWLFPGTVRCCVWKRLSIVPWFSALRRSEPQSHHKRTASECRVCASCNWPPEEMECSLPRECHCHSAGARSFVIQILMFRCNSQRQIAGFRINLVLFANECASCRF